MQKRHTRSEGGGGVRIDSNGDDDLFTGIEARGSDYSQCLLPTLETMSLIWREELTGLIVHKEGDAPYRAVDVSILHN